MRVKREIAKDRKGKKGKDSQRERPKERKGKRERKRERRRHP